MLVKSTVDRIFPLLCPVREYDWIPHWSCDMIFSESGFAEDNCMFETPFTETGGKDLWIVSTYDPPKKIEFLRVNEWRVIRYNISLHPKEEGLSSLVWEQLITLVSAEGEDWFNGYTQEKFSSLIDKLALYLNDYIKNQPA